MRFSHIAAAFALFSACLPAFAADAPDFSKSEFSRKDGFLTLQVDRKTNKVFAQLPLPDANGVSLRMIHTAGLAAGLGSNPVGLDRGWWQDGEIMVFRRAGDKLVLEIENLKYRADATNPLEARAVRESFATSYVAATDILSDSGRLTVDLTPFLTSDYLKLVQYLADADQGSFKVADDRSFVDTANVHVFPDNVEIDVQLTLTSSKPDSEVSTTAAIGNDVTLTQHHSFVRLPDAGYTPLKADPRTGAISLAHYNYSVALDEPIEVQLARRFRLEKDATGKTINPIIFYIDPGAPEPIRSALMDGAKWWTAAFAAAGFPDGYKVELLPENAHPLDIRYNVVQWVHRQTRGWSYGGGIADPRTGEMLKGHVILGSLRVRQDRMIFEGLSGTSKTGTGTPDDPTELALARIRQLAAHEIGHALGFAHNFAASTYGFGSVMDYPAPNIQVKNGELDFSNAYGVGTGIWDAFAATWLYGDFSSRDRETFVRNGISSGLVFVDDTHARDPGTGHPLGNIWDNGKDPVAALTEALEVRRIALNNFGSDRVAEGHSIADLKSVIVPIYLFHRYETAAAAKVLGGMTFNYGLRGDGQAPATPVPAADQLKALKVLLRTIDPAELDLSDDVLNLLTPSIESGFAADPRREMFRASADPAFDLISAAETAADMSFGIMLHPKRVARLEEFHRRDPASPGADEVMGQIRATVMRKQKSPRLQPISEAVRTRYAYALLALTAKEQPSVVASAASNGLAELQKSLKADGTAHSRWLIAQIETLKDDPSQIPDGVRPAGRVPPGGPIGMTAYESCWFCD